jgi:hypothetical protein
MEFKLKSSLILTLSSLVGKLISKKDRKKNLWTDISACRALYFAEAM